MRTYVLACCLLSAGISSHAQGTVGALIYQTARFSGKAVPIYGIDPTDPTYVVRGDNLAFYARREPVMGTGYWAELWAGPQSATEAGLAPVPGSKVHFRDDISAIRGSDNLRLPGTFGGDVVTLQLRVWTAFYDGRDLSSWLDVSVEPGAPRGTSSLTRMTLGNISADGHIFLPELLSFHLEGFGQGGCRIPRRASGRDHVGGRVAEDPEPRGRLNPASECLDRRVRSCSPPSPRR